MRKLQPAVFFLDLFLPSLKGCLGQRGDRGCVSGGGFAEGGWEVVCLHGCR